MSLTDLLGAMMQSGMAPSSRKRAKERSWSRKRRPHGEPFRPGGRQGGDLGRILGGPSIPRAVPPEESRTLQWGAGCPCGRTSRGSTRSMGGALGRGAMALIGAIAFKALQGAGQKTDNVPLGLLQPRNQAEQQKLEQQTELVLKAMINAAKSDGRISEDEIQRIVGKLKEAGAQDDDMRYVMSEMQKPIDTYSLMAAAKGQPELAAELYAASLMAIEVDTTAEKAYLQELAGGMGLSPEVTRQIDQMVGL